MAERDRRPVSLAHLSDVLALTFRVHDWVELPGIGKVALNTSPSGGARHPIEIRFAPQFAVGGSQFVFSPIVSV